MESGERGMTPVAMTIINPRKEYWLSWGWNQRPPVLKSATLPTELFRSTMEKGEKAGNQHILLFHKNFQPSRNKLQFFTQIYWVVFTGDSSQIRVSWTIFNQYLTSPLS